LKILPFKEAKDFVHKFGLESLQEWGVYCKSGKKPIVIPTHPERAYSTEWKGMGDWLGSCKTATFDRKYRQFNDAREFAQSLHLKSLMEWRQYCKSGKVPKDIPRHPDGVYKSNWKGWGDWLGTGNIAWGHKNFQKEVFLNRNNKWMEFDYAKAFVKSLGLKSRFEWKLFCKSGKKPDNIPEYPAFIYPANWKGWSDWLGSTNFRIKFKSFVDARRYSRALKLKSKKQWIDFCNSGKKIPEVPVAPENVYKSQWKGWGDWLGTGIIANMKRKFVPFEEGRDFAKTLHLKSSSDWEDYRIKKRLPKEIPTHPERTYSTEWKGWGDWLGTKTLREIKFRPFQAAREFVHSLHFQNRDQFARFCKTMERPRDIPTQPRRIYSKEWKRWGDWLGTDTVATWKRDYLPFEEARQFVRSALFRYR